MPRRRRSSTEPTFLGISDKDFSYSLPQTIIEEELSSLQALREEEADPEDADIPVSARTQAWLAERIQAKKPSRGFLELAYRTSLHLQLEIVAEEDEEEAGRLLGQTQLEHIELERSIRRTQNNQKAQRKARRKAAL